MADTNVLTWTNANRNRVILVITVLIPLAHFNVNQSNVNRIRTGSNPCVGGLGPRVGRDRTELDNGALDTGNCPGQG